VVRKIVCVLIFLACAQKFALGVEPIKPKAGEAAVNFELLDLDGDKAALADFKNKTVVLFFWTTWCPYCRQELENLNEEYRRYQKEGVEILPIDVAERGVKVVSFMKRNNFNFRVLLDSDGVVSKDYDLLGVPTYILIDQQGYIRSRGNTFPLKELKSLEAASGKST
jgi:peroxiredoxin